MQLLTTAQAIEELFNVPLVPRRTLQTAVPVERRAVGRGVPRGQLSCVGGVLQKPGLSVSTHPVPFRMRKALISTGSPLGWIK